MTITALLNFSMRGYASQRRTRRDTEAARVEHLSTAGISNTRNSEDRNNCSYDR